MSDDRFAHCHEVLDLVNSPRPIEPDWLVELPADFLARVSLANNELTVGEEVPDDLWLKVIQAQRLSLMRSLLSRADDHYRQLRELDRRSKLEWRRTRRRDGTSQAVPHITSEADHAT